MSEAVVLLLITTAAGAVTGSITAVWKLLSSRLSGLEKRVVLLTAQVTALSEEKVRAESERDLYKERLADVKQRLTASLLYGSKLYRLFEQALDLRIMISDILKLKEVVLEGGGEE